MGFPKKIQKVVEDMEEQEEQEEQVVQPKRVGVVKMQDTWKVMQVPSTFEPAIVDEANEEVLTQLQATAKILNELKHIRKALGE
jgi:hypothetical protein